LTNAWRKPARADAAGDDPKDDDDDAMIHAGTRGKHENNTVDHMMRDHRRLIPCPRS
jgi:hypothetical protein